MWYCKSNTSLDLVNLKLFILKIQVGMYQGRLHHPSIFEISLIANVIRNGFQFSLDSSAHNSPHLHRTCILTSQIYHKHAADVSGCNA